MASLRCLRVTMCTDQWYFTICEVVKRDRAPRIEAARKSDSRSEGKKQIWCRGPGTNGSRHPLHHQGRGINPSCAMRCTLALHRPSPKQHGRPTFVEPARTEASNTECHTFRLVSVTLAFTGKCARFMVFSCGRATHSGRRTGYTADHPCIPKPHKIADEVDAQLNEQCCASWPPMLPKASKTAWARPVVLPARVA